MTRPTAILVSFLAGAIALSYEILWFRVFSFASGGAAPVFPLLLGSYLTGVAGGAYLIGRICSSGALTPRRAAFLPADFLLIANVAGFLLIPAFARLLTVIPHWSFWLMLVAPVTALLGAVYPLINHLAIDPAGRVGPGVAELYLANILGSAAGSLLTGLWLLERWPLREVATIIGLKGRAEVVKTGGVDESQGDARCVGADDCERCERPSGQPIELSECQDQYRGCRSREQVEGHHAGQQQQIRQRRIGGLPRRERLRQDQAGGQAGNQAKRALRSRSRFALAARLARRSGVRDGGCGAAVPAAYWQQGRQQPASRGLCDRRARGVSTPST